MKYSKILFNILLFMMFGMSQGVAQLADPSVNGATISPAPNMYPGGSATVSFNFLNASPTAIPANPGNHINLSLSNLAVGGVFNPATHISGPGASYFSFTYNSLLRTLTGTQILPLPGFSGGQIIFSNLSVTGPSSLANPQNGLNVNVVFLGAFNGSTTNDNTNAFTYASVGGPLPVSLINLNYKVKNCGVNLTWTTLQELNSKEFLIQNSVDGTNWSTVGAIAGKGNSSGVSDYSFVHPNPLPGTNYYRIVIAEKDGSKRYSDVLSINIECFKQVINVNPNPFVDEVGIYLTSQTDEMITIKMFDNTGKEVQNKMVKIQKGSNTITFDHLASLSHGVYMIQIKTNNNILTQKLVK